MSEKKPEQSDYDIKVLYAKTQRGLDKKFERWQEIMKARPHYNFSVEAMEPFSFQFGPTGLWTFYGVAVLYTLRWKP